jgi:hypothetical protein
MSVFTVPGDYSALLINERDVPLRSSSVIWWSEVGGLRIEVAAKNGSNTRKSGKL